MKLNIHDVLTIDIDEAFPWKREWHNILTNMDTVNETDEQRMKPSIKLVYGELRAEGMYKIEDGLYVDHDSVLDLSNKFKIKKSKDEIILIARGPCFDWIRWSIQLVLLQHGMTFIHSAGIARESKVTVISSLPRVGKTTMITNLVRNEGWKLLGDDLLIVCNDGRCYSMLKPIRILPHHLTASRELFDVAKTPRNLTFSDKTYNMMASSIKKVLSNNPKLLQFVRRHNPLISELMPEDVFGRESIQHLGALGRFIWLERTRAERIEISTCGKAELASRIMGTTLHVFLDAYAFKAINIAATSGIFDNKKVICDWYETILDSMEEAEGYIMKIPLSLYGERFINGFKDALKKLN